MAKRSRIADRTAAPSPESKLRDIDPLVQKLIDAARLPLTDALRCLTFERLYSVQIRRGWNDDHVRRGGEELHCGERGRPSRRSRQEALPMSMAAENLSSDVSLFVLLPKLLGSHEESGSHGTRVPSGPRDP